MCAACLHHTKVLIGLSPVCLTASVVSGEGWREEAHSGSTLHLSSAVRAAGALTYLPYQCHVCRPKDPAQTGFIPGQTIATNIFDTSWLLWRLVTMTRRTQRYLRLILKSLSIPLNGTISTRRCCLWDCESNLWSGRNCSIPDQKPEYVPAELYRRDT